MDASLRSAQRLLSQWVPHVRSADGPGPRLETLPGGAESPRLVSVRTVEGGTLRARRVPGEPVAAFGGFLDGVQASHVVAYYNGVPLIHGAVGAVIRARRNRRLVTHGRGPRIDRSLYVPRAFVPPALWAAAVGGSSPVVDTTAAGDDRVPPNDAEAHPTALAERAVHLVERRREQLERALAEHWCTTEDAPLYIDGGVSGSETVASAACSVGVVKHHRTLYVAPEQISVLAAMRAGERTTVFRIVPSRRTPVLSWYLRLRDAGGRSPTWGLVRVEVADLDPAAVTTRADEVSRWILAERAPVALPDPRWDTMSYGIRDCEEFLRATMR